MNVTGCRAELLKNNGTFAGDLQLTRAPRVTMDANSEIGRSVSVTAVYDDAVEYLDGGIRVLLVENGIEKNVGVFIIATVKDSVSENGQHLAEITGYDGCYALKRHKPELGFHFVKGTRYTDAVISLLVDAKVSLQSVEPSDFVLSCDRDWVPGADALTVANELLDEIGYGHLRFDSAGYAICAPWPSFSGQPSIVLSKVSPDAEREIDAWDKPNVFVVTAPYQDEILTATAENNSPLSPLSTFRRGRKIVERRQLEGIPSQAALNAYAADLAAKSILTGELVTVRSPLVAGIEAGAIIGLQHPVYFGLYRAQRWEMEIKAGGIMQHTLARLII